MKQRSIVLGTWTLTLTTATGAYAADGASVPSGQASAALGNPSGGEIWMVAIVGGVAGGLVAGAIVAAVIASQARKAVDAKNAQR